MMILDLKNKTSWEPIIRKALEANLGCSYTDIVAGNADKIKYRDSEEEACNLFSSIIGRKQLIEVVVNEISKKFKEVMAYHACRPRRVDDYYENGIIPLNPIAIQKQFRDSFSSLASQEDIDAAIAAVPTKERDGVVHVVLDDRVLVESSGQYLIYGSEYISCLAFNLPRNSESAHDILKRIGKATVFICHLPFSTITDSLEYLVSRMIADHFFRIARNRNDVNVIDYVLTFEQTIEPKNIAQHYFPVRIKDPYKQRAVWNDELMQYE